MKMTHTKNDPFGSAIAISIIAAAGSLAAWLLFHTIFTLPVVELFMPFTWESVTISATGGVFVKSASSNSSSAILYEYRNGRLHESEQIEPKGLPSSTLKADLDSQSNPLFSSGIVDQVVAYDKPGQRWFSIARGPSNLYFEGFDSHTHQRLGFIGKEGLTLEQPDAQIRFPTATKNGQSSIVIREWSEDPPNFVPRIGIITTTRHESTHGRIVVLTPELPYSIDPFNGTVKAIHLPVFPLSASIWKRRESRDDEKSNFISASGIVFRGKEVIYLSDDNDVIVESFPIPYELKERSFDLYLPIDSNPYLLTTLNPNTRMTEIFRLDSKGNVVSRENIDLSTGSASRRSKSLWISAILCPVLPFTLWCDFVVMPQTEVDRGFAVNVESERKAMLYASWPPLLLITLLSLVLAIWTYRRHQKYDRKSALVWSVFVFLLGPAGLVGYLAHRIWPAREKCRSCGEAIRVDRMTCSKCGEEFPLPALNGSEILVPA